MKARTPHRLVLAAILPALLSLLSSCNGKGHHMGMPGALKSERMDFSRPDRAVGLGTVLWMATRPDDPLPPQLLHEQPRDEERWVLPVPLGPAPADKDRR